MNHDDDSRVAQAAWFFVVFKSMAKNMPLRVRIILPIAVVPGFPDCILSRLESAHKGDRGRFSRTIPTAPLFFTTLSIGYFYKWGKTEMKSKATEKARMMAKVVLAFGLAAGLGLPVSGQRVSADAVYTYTDAATPLAINGSGVKMSGEHVVWHAYSGKLTGQIVYGNARTGETTAITNHGKPTDTPAVGVNGKGEVVVVWADKRDYSDGSGNMNWDIYSYNMSTRKETKLNDKPGQHRIPSIDGDIIVWQTNPDYEMHLYDLSSGTLTDLGYGRDPIVAKGRVIYKGAYDGCLYAYTLATGEREKIVDLPYTQFVERFVAGGDQILWKQRDADGNGKYVYLDLGAAEPKPVDLTEPAPRGTAEYKQMSISDGKAVWLDGASGGLAVMHGADLKNGGAAYTVGLTRASQFVGFNGDELSLVNGSGYLISRDIIRTEQTDSSSEQPGDTPAEPDNGSTQPDEADNGGTQQAGSPDGTVSGTDNGAAQPGGATAETGSGGTQPEGTVIGPDGGAAADGQAVRMEFGQGAFDANTRVVLKKAVAAPAGELAQGMSQQGSVWSWKADAELKKPATLSFELDSPLKSGGQANRAGIYRYDEKAGSWVYAGGTVDSNWKSVRAEVREPGVYGLFIYEPSFADMKTHWAKNEVEILASKWIVNGVKTGVFEPSQSVTRAQFAKMLVEASGLASASAGSNASAGGNASVGGNASASAAAGSASFRDVTAKHWAAKWVEQAAAAGWVKGYEGGLFKPNAPVTREEMTVMLVQAAGLGQTQSAASDSGTDSGQEQSGALDGYTDSGKVHDWAKPAVQTAVKRGMIQGNGDKLNPGAVCTRAEAAAVIYRWLAMKGEVFNG